VVPEDGLRRLLATCEGKSFEERRDTALILLLVDVGPRRAELVGLRVSDVDFDLDVLLVLGKGRRERALPFGRRSAVALDRYLRVRARRRDAALPWLWLGREGRLTEWGLVQMLHRRGDQAGLPGLYPHQLRHTFAHEWLAQGGGETDLMRLAGWKSRAITGCVHVDVVREWHGSFHEAPSRREEAIYLHSTRAGSGRDGSGSGLGDGSGCGCG
jgi:site-specific recombinase XerD